MLPKKQTANTLLMSEKKIFKQVPTEKDQQPLVYKVTTCFMNFWKQL